MSEITHPYQGHYMEAAFVGFMRFAAIHLMDQFYEDCGEPNLGATAIDRMIDKATGQDVRELQKFVDWCVVQFGTPEQIEAPDA